MKKLLIGLFWINSIVLACEPSVDKFMKFIFDPQIKEQITPDQLRAYCEERVRKADAIQRKTLEGNNKMSELHHVLNPSWMGNDTARCYAHYSGHARLNWAFPDEVYKKFKGSLKGALLARDIQSDDDTVIGIAEQEMGIDAMDGILAADSKALAQAILKKLHSNL